MQTTSTKPSVLMAWIGDADFGAAAKNNLVRPGPIYGALSERNFTHAFLLSARKEGEAEQYKEWLLGHDCSKNVVVELYQQNLTSPTEFREIYECTRQTLEAINRNFKISNCSLTFHLSPGTPIMAAVWIFLAKTAYPADLIVSSVPSLGIQNVAIPYEITVSPEFIQQTGKPRVDSTPAAFNNIIYKCDAMRKLIQDAHNVSLYENIPVLILGESGTGKELFAKAIHKDSKRGKGPFKAINCGAFNKELLQSELFGHEKGAFTGAQKEHEGIFQQADGGVVFLDEIGEMAKDLQVNLLRVIQEKKITRLGGRKEITIDVRVIAATNRNIYDEVSKGNFRNDLFWRLAGKILELPPLRERCEDIAALVSYFLDRINDEYKEAWKPKKLTSPAMDLLCKHSWPGNIRELEQTILRAAIATQNEMINEEDVQRAILLKVQKDGDPENILNQKLTKNFDLVKLLNEVAGHYIRKALSESNGKKTKAAKLLGFKNHQTFTNWMKKLGNI